MDFRPGETLLVSGATGNFGSATVALALAMGARCVVAPGRNTAVLDDLRRRFGQRVVPVRLSGDGAADTDTMKRAAPGPIDAVQDFLPPSVGAGVARAAIMTLRQGGRAVLMGGVGMLGGEDLALPYPWIMRNLITVRGQWMYDTAAIPGLVSLVRSGLLDLGHWATTTFPLTGANDAVAHAASQRRAIQADGARAVIAGGRGTFETKAQVQLVGRGKAALLIHCGRGTREAGMALFWLSDEAWAAIERTCRRTSRVRGEWMIDG
jgi:threonine dehydrogenase-like Zn-dependent dehydrogenase